MRTATMHRTLITLGLAAMIGCSDSTGNAATGTVTIRLTDAPIDNVQSATIWVSKVYLVGSATDETSRVTISEAKAEYNLLALQNGVTASLGSAEIPVGTYGQLRLVVDSAKIVLKAPLTFADGTSQRTLVVPSGEQSGLKVNFALPVQVTAGQTVLVADFDVSRSFVLMGPRSAPTGAHFKPVIHSTVQNVAASIAGTVTPASSNAGLAAVSVATGDTVATALADVTTGAYKIWYLPPGTYTVLAKGTAVASTFEALKANVVVGASQNLTGVNLP